MKKKDIFSLWPNSNMNESKILWHSGFSFFYPGLRSGTANHFDLWACYSDQSTKNIFSNLMQNQYFPVQFEDMGAHCAIQPMAHHRIDVNGGKVIASVHIHPGSAWGYRFETDGKVVVYCTDVEHPKGIDKSVVALAKEADLLIHDAQYTPEELETHKEWGHSSWEQAIAIAEQAHVKQLVLSHHDPDHDDAFLEKMEKDCQDKFKNCLLARDNMAIEI